MPLLSVPLLAGGDGLDNTSVRWLLQAALKKKKEEEERKVQERKERVMQDIHRRIHANEVTDAEWAAWKVWHGISSSSSGGQKRKRKKRRKRKLPRNSSCPRLAAMHLGRYGPEGHLRRDTVSAFVARAVRTWKPGLSTCHWFLAPCSVPVTPEEHRKMWSFLGVHYAVFFYGPLYLAVTCAVYSMTRQSFFPSSPLECKSMDFSGRRLLVCFPYSVHLGSTVDTCLASVYQTFFSSTLQILRILRSCSSSKVVDILFVPQIQVPWSKLFV